MGVSVALTSGHSLVKPFTYYYRAKLRGIAKASCLSVCLSVTLRYRDHIGWNSAKIISRLISLTISFHSLQTST